MDFPYSKYNPLSGRAAPLEQGCEIRISAQREGNQVCIAVANQGVLQSAGSSTHIGLENTSKRLALLFDGKASLTVVQDQGWVVATISLPGETR